MQTIEQIEAFVREELRPLLHAHGGDIRVLGLEDGVLRVQLLGECANCPSGCSSIQDVVLQEFRQHFPGIERVEFVQTVSDELLEQARKILRHEMD